MQHLFQVDPFNYNGQVFAGLACLQLGEYEESKKHYKGAITQQPDGPLAWKVCMLHCTYMLLWL
jgi:superkiller protein 3